MAGAGFTIRSAKKLVDAARDVHSRSERHLQKPQLVASPEGRPVVFFKITGETDGEYSLKLQRYNTTSDKFEDDDRNITHDTAAVAVNGEKGIANGTVVPAWIAGRDSEGKTRWVFPAPMSELRPVTVTKDGGVAGGWSTTCSFTYTVTDLAGNELATSASPDRARMPNTAYSEPSANSPGLAYRDADGNWKLYDAAEEVPVTTTLEPLSDVDVDGAAATLGRKKTPIRVLAADVESAREVYHTGTECEEPQ